MLTKQHDMQNGPCHLFILFLFFKCRILFVFGGGQVHIVELA
jgi:hypothetical protein